MRFFLLCSLLLAPLCVFAYASVVALPEDQATVLPIEYTLKTQEFFGRLGGYPHTFEFTITEDTLFSASIFVPDRAVQKNDISIIVVKEERRGVSEVGRTVIKDQSWEQTYDAMLAETFRSGGNIKSQLQSGVYRLEVSSPNNEGKYRVVLGTGKVQRGYFENLHVLFEVKSFLDNSKWSAIKSPLIYVPLLALLLIGVCFYIFKYKRRKVQ